MKKNKSNFLKKHLAPIFLISLLACQDLDEKPPGLVNPENFYTTIAQAEASLGASMDALWSEWGPNYSYGYGNFTHDDVLDGGDLDIGNGYGSNLWNQHYIALKNINGVVKAVQDGSITSSDEQSEIPGLLGQARFLRAFNYFALVRLFGDLPLITEGTPNSVVNPITQRTPIADVYTLIVSDLEFAIANLPLGQSPKPSKGAAQALLAKVYLTMATAPLNKTENYAKARDVAKALMDEGTYSLIPDIFEVFKLENKYGPENIFSYNSTEDDQNTDPQIWTPGIMDGWGDASFDLLWTENWFASRPNEPRQDAYLILEYDGVPWQDFDEARPFLGKYVMPNIPQEEYDAESSTANMPILRYADVLLMYAEAANMAASGPSAEAYEALNMVRRRANNVALDVANPAVDLTPGLSQANFDKAVIEEREFELVMEFDRWHDIVRKRLLQELTVKYHPENLGNFSDNDYLYPIPDYDAKILGSQNPGYTTDGN
jgi:starch-binding outer membrane protein, SusD/RagB family